MIQGVSIFKTFCPHSDAIKSGHSFNRNAPKLAYSNLRFQQNLPREKPPDPGASTPLTDGSRIFVEKVGGSKKRKILLV